MASVVVKLASRSLLFARYQSARVHAYLLGQRLLRPTGLTGQVTNLCSTSLYRKQLIPAEDKKEETTMTEAERLAKEEEGKHQSSSLRYHFALHKFSCLLLDVSESCLVE